MLVEVEFTWKLATGVTIIVQAEACHGDPWPPQMGFILNPASGGTAMETLTQTHKEYSRIEDYAQIRLDDQAERYLRESKGEAS